MVRIEKDESTRGELLADMDRDVLELEALVAELLDYIRTGDLEQAPGDSFELRGVLEDIVANLETTSPVELVLEAGGPAPLVGERLFRRALGNLISNARRFARSKVIIGTALASDEVEISVRDDGPGIDPDDRSRVLEPFVQLETDADHSDGFGLGLAIVARIAERVGGRVGLLESELGGTRVDLVWPRSGLTE